MSTRRSKNYKNPLYNLDKGLWLMSLFTIALYIEVEPDELLLCAKEQGFI